VTIVVGIATVLAINIFGSSAEQANEDMVRQDVASIASGAQSWYIKPAMLGGGNNTFDGLDFTRFAFPCETLASNNSECTNLNGLYTIVSTSDSMFTLTAVPVTSPNNFTVQVRRNRLDYVANSND
jgi:hypothetical protein